MPHYSVSPEGLAFIQAFEGFAAEPLTLPDGRFLIGYGAASSVARPIGRNAAAQALQADLDALARELSGALPEGLSQAQFDALASFAHSIGWEAFARSEALRRVRAGEITAAALAMGAWRASSAAGEGEVLEPLVRRRIAEQALFLFDAPQICAPSVLARPEMDRAYAMLAAPASFGRLPALTPAPMEEPLLLDQPIVDDVASVSRGDAAALAIVGTCGTALIALAAALTWMDPSGGHGLAAAVCGAVGLAGLSVGAVFLWGARDTPA